MIHLDTFNTTNLLSRDLAGQSPIHRHMYFWIRKEISQLGFLKVFKAVWIKIVIPNHTKDWCEGGNFYHPSCSGETAMSLCCGEALCHLPQNYLHCQVMPYLSVSQGPPRPMPLLGLYLPSTSGEFLPQADRNIDCWPATHAPTAKAQRTDSSFKGGTYHCTNMPHWAWTRMLATVPCCSIPSPMKNSSQCLLVWK